MKILQDYVVVNTCKKTTVHIHNYARRNTKPINNQFYHHVMSVIHVRASLVPLQF